VVPLREDCERMYGGVACDKAGIASPRRDRKAYVEQCRGGRSPTAAVPQPDRQNDDATRAQASHGHRIKNSEGVYCEWRADKPECKPVA